MSVSRPAPRPKPAPKPAPKPKPSGGKLLKHFSVYMKKEKNHCMLCMHTLVNGIYSETVILIWTGSAKFEQ